MIKCEVLLRDRKYHEEYAYSLDEFKKIEIPLINIKKCKKHYVNYVATFDIETSKIEKGNDEYEGFIYHWQFCINGIVIFGRDWLEFAKLIYYLKEELVLSNDKKLVVYVHNLSYEFHFLYNLFYVSDVFCIDKRKVLKCILDDFIELRCSYYLSNMNLSKFIENTPNAQHIKALGDLDYSKLYLPSTQLLSKEYGYCYNDVYGLFECIRERLKEFNLNQIPLTSTGYVRRECRKNMNKNLNNRKIFEKLALNQEVYDLLRDCFRGGNTASNRYHTNVILDNVSSYDMTSAYPYVMLSEKYPMSKFIYYDLESFEELDYYNKRYCTIGYYYFSNIKLKNNIPIPYIPISKCLTVVKDEDLIVYNGRLISSTGIKIALTNIDYEIIKNQYDFDYDDLRVENFYFARKGFLPKELRETIIEYYELKTQLKGINDKAYEYMKSKNKLNSLYGMIVTNIQRKEILFDSEKDEVFSYGEKGLLEDYYNSRNNFLSYQWGVFVTAYCRRNLQLALDGIGLDVVYCDTDSVKYLNNHDEVFNKINYNILKYCEEYDILNYARRDNKKYYLGVYDFEGTYQQFKTLGAKKYAFLKNDKYGIAVSGLSKIKGAKELEKNGLEFFKNGSVFYDSGRTTVKFNNDKIHYLQIGNDKIINGSNVVILDTTYTLGISNTMLDIIDLCNNRKGEN